MDKNELGLGVTAILFGFLAGHIAGRMLRMGDDREERHVRENQLKFLLNEEHKRLEILLRRSEVLDQRAGTLLSALVIVGGVLGAFWSFVLSDRAAPTVERLADNPWILTPLIAAIALYWASAVTMACSLLISVYVFKTRETLDTAVKSEVLFEEAWSQVQKAANRLGGISNWKWVVLIVSLALFAMAIAAIGAFAVQVFVNISGASSITADG